MDKVISKIPKISTVLIVDDMPESINILNQILSEEYQILFALDGVTALTLSTEQKPDIILLDIMMPGMDGYQVCQKLKSNPDTQDIPVIFITAKDRDEDEEIGFKIGASDYLSKPVRPAIVKSRVKNQLQIKHNEELILQQALYDSLTQLPNRTLSIDRLRYSIAQDLRNQLLTALFFIDIDNFKNINDSLGHDNGDLLLIEVAKRFQKRVRNVDTIGRLGGDEFVIILPGLELVDDAKLIAESILRSFAEPIFLAEMEITITVSIGIAFSPTDSDDYKQLLIDSDTALYQSKQAGRNSYHLFNEEMNHNVKRRMMVEHHLHHALESNEISVYYQPLIDLKSGLVIGAEALIRWKNEILGEVQPSEFICLAEQSGMIESLGEFVLEQSCTKFKDLVTAQGSPLCLAVNVSPQQFRRNDFPSLVSKILKKTGFSAERLEIEVTEGLLLGSNERIKQALQNLRLQGIRLSMDDFGTGYSSLSYVREFPFDIIKIDRSFVMDMVTKQEDHSLVNAIIAMAHALGLTVIAEGIEEQEQLQMLKKGVCDIGQGYYFSKPVGFEVFVQNLEEINRLT